MLAHYDVFLLTSSVVTIPEQGNVAQVYFVPVYDNSNAPYVLYPDLEYNAHISAVYGELNMYFDSRAVTGGADRHRSGRGERVRHILAEREVLVLGPSL